jgi:hypothetical protein
VSVTAEDLVERDGTPAGPVAPDGTFLESLSARLSVQHGVDSRAVRSLAAQVLAIFAGAMLRGPGGLGAIPAAHEGSAAVKGMTAVVGPRP